MAAYILTIFVGAFLLFQVQPIVARYILPWFGGTPAVWTTCMLFFQLGLVGGYLYAHALGRRLAPRMQAITHLVVLGLSLLLLPITPSSAWKPTGQEDATFRIISLLLATVGVPYVILASTSPLLQHWFNRTHSQTSPYRLYALSNLGSLLGLLTYPFVVEPLLDVDAQTRIWSAGYGFFVLTGAFCAFPLLRRIELQASPQARHGVSPKPGPSDVVSWVVLAACGSTLLLATTNQICQDVAVIPFLWILPLSLYLLTFIICFEKERWYQRDFWVPVFLVTLATSVYILHKDNDVGDLPILVEISVHSAALFAACMICHGELIRIKPPPAHLTSFYVMVAMGGALGGIFVGIVAPHVFRGFWEFHTGLGVTYVLLGVFALRGIRASLGRPLAVILRSVWGLGGVLLAFSLGTHIADQRRDVIDMRRSFYGVLRVCEYYDDMDNEIRSLLHGRITHGVQFVDEDYRALPVSYYGPESGIAVAIEAVSGAPFDCGEEELAERTALNMGVVGLGTGCLATFGEEGDRITFYEINPDVVAVANEFFYFIHDNPATFKTVLGDARLSLEREVSAGDQERFNLLVVDAFSGDAVPIHLLTREAFQLYWQRLQPDGVLAMQITNQHLDLRPLVRGLARESGLEALWIPNEDDDEENIWAADWVLITANDRIKSEIRGSELVEPWPAKGDSTMVWTDKFSNLVSVLY